MAAQMKLIVVGGGGVVVVVVVVAVKYREYEYGLFHNQLVRSELAY